MTQPAGQPDRIGEVLDGKYRITRIIGQGGMGAVYAGEHIRVKRTVAIKILHAGANGVDEMAERFEREAQAAGKIGSEHIVEVYDLGMTAAGERFMVMEYLEGEPLRSRIKRQGRLSPGEIVGFFGELLEGLAGAHAAGIIHRDLKPDNVFLVKEKAGRRDFVKILDFGISKFTHMEDGAMTRTGVVMGSPNYMSPEHVKTSSEVDARSDLYSVGIMLFEAACGQVPRRGATFAELLFKVVYEPVADVRTIAPEVPGTLAQIIHKACAAERAHRFQTAQEFRAALLGLGRELENQLAEAGTGRFVDESSGQSTVALSAAGLGPGFSSGVVAPNGTLAAPGFGAGSQPSFGGAAPPSFGAGSQPSFGAGSQPSFGAGSQPSFGAGSQPSLGAGSQPSFGAGSQPSFGAGSQPSFGAGSQPSFVGVAQPTSAHGGAAGNASRGGRGLSVVAVSAAAIVGVGLSLAVAYFAIGGKQSTAAAGSAAQPSHAGEPPRAAAAATAVAATTAASTEIPSETGSAEPGADASPPEGSAEPSRPQAGTAARPIQRPVGAKPSATSRASATSAPVSKPVSKPAEPDLGY